MRVEKKESRYDTSFHSLLFHSSHKRTRRHALRGGCSDSTVLLGARGVGSLVRSEERPIGIGESETKREKRACVAYMCEPQSSMLERSLAAASARRCYCWWLDGWNRGMLHVRSGLFDGGARASYITVSALDIRTRSRSSCTSEARLELAPRGLAFGGDPI